MRTEYVETVLGRLRVQVGESTGETMVFWTSLLMTGDMWQAQAAHFGDRYRVVLVDPPGHGGSADLAAMFSFADCARCIVDVLDGLGVQRGHLIGNSLGGMIGATFAASYPDRVGASVLMNCTASAAGLGQKIEYGSLLQIAKLLGGIRPPLTARYSRRFWGPTTFSTRPEVVAVVEAAVQAVRISSASWAVRSVVPARPDQSTARCDPHPGAGSGRYRGRHLSDPGDDGHGSSDPRRQDGGTGRRHASGCAGGSRTGQSAD